ncbi:MAG: YqjF family protein [Planctomycetota bacterium]|jgi:uncharacterized protein YqjF (DUF2071 family)
MQWYNLLFCHWPVPVGALRRVVPELLEIDRHEGTAWVGLVPFSMRGVRLPWLPPLPTLHRFHECNVRTYVRHRGEPGVWFFSLDAVSRLAVWGARRFWHLNYVHAAIDAGRDGDVLTYDLRRVRTPEVTMRCRWRAGASLPRSEPGTLEHFLSERYLLYSIDPRGRVHRGRVHHEPWTLREATLETLDDRLVAAAGLEVPPGTDPVLMHADHIDVTADPLERC